MSKAKLFVRGVGVDPIELEQAEAEAAQALIGDPTKSKDTPFSIEGVWSGTKGDMKFVVFPKKEQETQGFLPVEPMIKEEADMFAAEIAPFIKKAKDEGYPRYCWIDFWLESIGACVITGRHETKSGKSLTIAVRPQLYEAAQKKRARFDAYQSRVAYAKQKDLEELQKMAEQVGDSMDV